MKYKPHDYQTYATNFILTHPISAVLLDMGLGKSVITLTAIFDLCLDSFLVRKVLVIAPLRVARDTWPAEIQKWDHLHGLSYSVAVGNELERKAALMQDVSVYIINRENVQWLVEQPLWRTSSARWQTVPFMQTRKRLSRSMNENWICWRTCSKQPTANRS